MSGVTAKCKGGPMKQGANNQKKHTSVAQPPKHKGQGKTYGTKHA